MLSGNPPEIVNCTGEDLTESPLADAVTYAKPDLIPEVKLVVALPVTGSVFATSGETLDDVSPCRVNLIGAEFEASIGLPSESLPSKTIVDVPLPPTPCTERLLEETLMMAIEEIIPVRIYTDFELETTVRAFATT